MAKKVAFFVESTSDTWVSISGGGTTLPVNTVVGSLSTTPGSGHVFQANDSNGITDACAEIPSGTANGLFQRPDMSTYSLNSNDFIGGAPPVRPH